MKIWIEKTIVNGQQHKITGDRAMGKVLWSPRTGSDGRDTYKNMRLVMPGDMVLHFVDNSSIAGVSIVENSAIETDGLAGTAWDNDAFLIKLKNYTELNPHVKRSALLNDKNKAVLQGIAENSEVFYNSNLNLRQGGYLTPCTIELVALINDIYKEQSNVNLPFFDELGIANNFQPDKIKRTHVIKALKEIDRGKTSLIRSTKFDILFEGKTYPPKDVLRLAHQYANGEHLWEITGGEPTNKYLKALGFLIINKDMDLKKALQPYISQYKELIVGSKDYDELYKWEAVTTFQNNWDLAASDIPNMIETAFPGNNNLWTRNNYYPIVMLRAFAEINPDKVTNALIDLFNDNEPLEDRILAYKNSMDELLEERNKITNQTDKQHYQDARTIGLLLAFNEPSKHFLFKYGILKSFCEKFAISYPKKGDIVNQILINEEISGLVRGILIEDKELLKIHGDRLTDTCFKGANYNLLTQDFIYSIVNYLSNDRKYWLYAPGENAEKWDQFYAEGIMALGWDELGDLNAYTSKKQIVEKLQILDDSSGSKKNDATANDEFIHVLSIGDIIFVKKGRTKLLGYGEVVSNYYFEEQSDSFKSRRDVKWLKKGSWDAGHDLVLKTLTNISDYKTDHPDYEFYYQRLLGTIEGDLESSSLQNTNTMDYPLNTIFYGPPGTGKTYSTLLRAAEIIEQRYIDDYNEAKAIFNSNLGGQIEFITFHQNYSYEDFIQGLRPETDHAEGLSFEKKDGVFKMIADKARKNWVESGQQKHPKTSFEEVFNKFISPLNEGEVNELEVTMKKVSFFITNVTTKSIEFRKDSGGTGHTLSLSTLKKMYDDESTLEIQGLSAYYSPLLKQLLDLGKIDNAPIEVVKKKNYVIIIDEINRANISRVFGELITLIEPDKRIGGGLPLKCTLPSGDVFMVPSNLYIIGTMNTADKSIALLDIALRRRFVFEAMYPKYAIADKIIHDVEILQKINKKIIESKGHDFQIGHAYFMGENNDLKNRMNYKVIPLLLEYFMNDENEVKAILNNSGLELEEGVWPLRINGKHD